MALSRQDKHVETLVRADESIDHADGVRRMHVVVNVAVHKHEVAFQVLGNLRVGLDGIYECSISGLDFLLNAMVLFAPPAVVNVVVMVTCAGNGGLEEIRVLQYRRSGHESAA